MEIIVTILFLFLNSGLCKAQVLSTYNFDYEIAYLNNPDSAAMLSWGYGYAGKSTPNIYVFSQLVAENRLDLIKNLLDSKVPATKYLATEVLEFAAKKKKIQLTDSEIQKIKLLYHSKELVPMKSGCTGRWNQSIGSLLKENHRKRSVINRWLKEL
jgi:hypothetical protein